MINHSTPRDEFISNITTNLNTGLSSQQAATLLGEHGVNLPIKSNKRLFINFLSKQLKSLPVILLCICMVLSVVVNVITYKPGFFEPFILFTAVIAYFVICGLQEYLADKRIDSLNHMQTPSCNVLRNGVVSKTDASYLVPGDILILNQGDFIPADARLIETTNLHCDESQLTGNTVPCEKNALAVCEELCPLQNRVNMVYYGCSVISGSGVAVVTETATQTELAKKHILNEKRDVYTPLTEKLTHSVNIFSNCMLVLCTAIFIITVLINIHSTEVLFIEKVTEKLTLVTALAIATVPVTLCGTLNIALTAGVLRMTDNLIVTKNIYSLAPLSKVSVICSDKTGTLTQNKMTAVAAFTGGEITVLSRDALDGNTTELLKLAALSCNDDNTNDPTQTALIKICEKIHKTKKSEIDLLYPRVAELPLDQERKLMTTVNVINGTNYCIVRGAPESILSICNAPDAELITKANDAMCEKGLRVVAIAYKTVSDLPANPTVDELECNLNFVGLIGLSDKIRSDVVESVELCKKSGIKPIMITGDHIITAVAFAKKLGILDDESQAINGDELSALTDEELFEKIENITVYARISPADKQRIVKAWQQKGATVAVTGDASDDTHALLAADVGCAMGISGDYVAKGTADIIVNNDNFTNVLTAVSQSRSVFKNAINAIHHILSTKFSIAVSFALCLIIFGKLPLTALQLIWLLLITGTFASTILCIDKPDSKILTEKFTLPSELVSRSLCFSMTWESALFAVLSVISFAIGGAKYGTATAFLTFVVCHLLHIFNVRTEKSVVTANYKNNLKLIICVLIGFLVTFISLATPVSATLGFAKLTSSLAFTAILLGLIPTLVCEGVKLYRKNK